MKYIEAIFPKMWVRVINGMLHHSLGGAVIFIPLKHFIAPTLDLMSCLKGQNTFSKIVALIVKEGRIRLEVDKERLALNLSSVECVQFCTVSFFHYINNCSLNSVV